MPTLRYALRSLKKSPGFVAIAVLALGLGLGLSTTMFAVMDAVMNPFVAYSEPERLFSINWWTGRRNPMTQPELYRFLRDNVRSFESIAPNAWERVTYEKAGVQEELNGRMVPPHYFTVLGVRTRLGRHFVESDGEGVAVLSEALWRRLFGSRRITDSPTVLVNGRQREVVGVLPRGTDFADIWLPMPAAIERGDAGVRFLRPVARLRRGVTQEQAAEELKSLARGLTERFGAQDAPFAFELYPIQQRREEIRDIHKAMVGAALVVLLIACVNLAHLMLARGLAKRRELALRLALGASRAAVVRQMFAECAIITAGGAVLGALVAVWGADLLRNRMPPEMGWLGLLKPQLSWRVFAASALAAAAAAAVFGLIPAIRVALGVNLDEPLKDDTGTTTGRVRHRYNVLVIAEVALSLVLLMGGGLLIRTIVQLNRVERGFDSSTLYQSWLLTNRRRAGDSTVTAGPTREEIRRALSAAEGVVDVALGGGRPLPGGGMMAELDGDSARVITALQAHLVSPNYLRVLGLPVLRGRDFGEGDAFGNGVAIIDPVAAQRLYPGREAVGRMIKLGGPRAVDAPWVPIVGIMRSPYILQSSGRYAPQPTVYVTSPDLGRSGPMIVRTTSANPRTPAQLQARIHALTGVRAWVMPYDFERAAELSSRAFLAKVFVTMGLAALALAAMGLYGVLAYAVGRRMREFAVRVALGAEASQLMRMVLHDGAVMLLAGTGLGAFAALAANRLLDSVLIAVLPSDVIALVLSEVLLLLVGFAAALAPARRAARANPLEILRAS